MIDYDAIELRSKLLGSLLFFTQFFFKLRTGRDFIVSRPVGRESHHIIICRELTDIFYLTNKRLYINVHPGSGKSELCCAFVAWSMAHYPDSNFLYISFSHQRSEDNTAIIKEIMAHPLYKRIFDVHIDRNSDAKGDFKTTKGGRVVAFGSAGSITGANAGLPGLDRFSGGVVMDDMHKPEEVHSDTIRESVIRNFQETISYRLRGENVFMLGIGQRLKEDDLFNYFDTKEKEFWRSIVLQTEDVNKNILYPEVNTPEKIRLAKLSEYAWAAQHQQNPIPSGGGIFKPEWFHLTDDDPKILATFITADTAETDKTYNDATVFSFWGLYKIMQGNYETDLYGLHWIDCNEVWIEPKDLQGEFMAFYSRCMMFHVKPKQAVIEKKSTGVTLVSVLKDMQGLQIIDINRTRASGSKTDRFLEIQQYIASKRVSLPRLGKHTNMCLDHCKKITANNTHARDDVADTLADAVKIALIDQTMIYRNIKSVNNETTDIIKTMANDFNRVQRLRSAIKW